MAETNDLTRGGACCGKCGGEKDENGDCANYCMDGPSEVRVGPAANTEDFDFSDLSEKYLDETLVVALNEVSGKETE